MQAVIKSIHSPDIESLETFKPDNPENFAFLLQLFIGPADSDGEESFDVEVYTPKSLIDRCAKNDVIFGMHRIIVFEYNYVRIVERLQQYVSTCEGDSWNEIAHKLALIGRWEFQDYQE